MILVEALYERTGGKVTDENPTGEYYFIQKQDQYIVLVGKSRDGDWFAEGDKVCVSKASMHQHLPRPKFTVNQKGGKVRPIKENKEVELMPNPDFKPPFILDRGPDLDNNDAYVMMVPEEFVLFKYGSYKQL